LDWSIRAMAVAELIALREQMLAASEQGTASDYDPRDRSLANTMRELRKCMRQLQQIPAPDHDLPQALSRATVRRYHNRTDKRSRYRPQNPDKKPLGDPNVKQISTEQRRKLEQLQQ